MTTTITIEQVCEAWLKHVRRNDLAANTLRAYRTRARQMIAFHRAETSYRALSREDWLDYIWDVNHVDVERDPDRPSKSASTVRANIVAVQLVTSYAAEEHDLPCPLKRSDLRKPPIPERTRIPTPEEVERILQALPRELRPLYQCLRLTGARPGELVNAQIEQIDPPGPPWDNCDLIIRRHKTSRKTGKPRTIPIGRHVAEVITPVIGQRIRGPIFVDQDGRAWNVPRISRIFRRIRDELKLSKSLVLYSTRHEFGTRVASSSDIHRAQELLGHTDIKTTRRYTHLSRDQLRKSQEEAFDDENPEKDTDRRAQD